MPDHSETAAEQPAGGGYTFRACPAVEDILTQRSAAEWAAFFLPHLRPGMRLLDCGCGPGSITIGLAAAVAPGEAVGIDLQPGQVAAARALAAARGVQNVRFELADLYALPFPDGSFDAVFANAVFLHLRDPERALAELRRVLRPGGVAGLQDFDRGTQLVSPASPLLEQAFALMLQVEQESGAHPFVARHFRHLLLTAGFSRPEATSWVWHAGTVEAMRDMGAFFQVVAPVFGRIALERGLVDETTWAAMLAELAAWGERPDGFWSVTLCAAVGWAPAVA